MAKYEQEKVEISRVTTSSKNKLKMFTSIYSLRFIYAYI